MPIECFSEVIARKQVLFLLMGLTDNSGRVQRWLARKGKKSLQELTLTEYESFCQSVQKAWETEQDQISTLIAQADSLLKELQIDWQHPVIQAFLHSASVQDDGLTTPHLKRLCEALQTEIHGDSDHDRCSAFDSASTVTADI